MTWTKPGDPLTIEFHGLCLFTVGTDKRKWVEVFLLQPHGHEVRRRVKLADGRFGATKVDEGEPFDFGPLDAGPVDLGTLATRTTKLNSLITSGTPRIAKPGDSHYPRGTRVVLRGGKLGVSSYDVGPFAAVIGKDDVRSCSFANVVTWTGEVSKPQNTPRLQLWNAMPDELPSIHPSDSKLPAKLPPADVRRARGREHFKACFQAIIQRDGPTIEFAGYEKMVLPPFGITVSSCPSALVDVDQCVPVEEPCP